MDKFQVILLCSRLIQGCYSVSFRGKYEIHWVYVRSTARIYELYHSTDAKGTSKDYLCTVRCGIAAKEPQPCGEESMSQGSGGAPTSDKRDHETKSVSSSSDEDSWVDVKIPESPMANNTREAQERNTIRICQENTLVIPFLFFTIDVLLY